MIFNSIEYLLFLPTVFTLYWFVFYKRVIVQNYLLLISSYCFYGWWDWRFLFLIIFSTIVDYFTGHKIHNTEKQNHKKYFLWLSIAFNIGVLAFFKYYNFFIDSWIELVSLVGYQIQNTWTLKVILPVGISFYTFQTMSYSLDIYYNKIKPTKDFIAFASFVSFFPQLVAGPIERASNLLPQILVERQFNYFQAIQGLRLILWGMFKKVVIADSLAIYVDAIFNNYDSLNGGILFLGLLYFSFQIYCDFSGYSDIAIGTAKLFGFEIISNFRYPIFSRDIGEFWRKWHISLSNWFKEYLYMPILIRLRNLKTFGLLITTFVTYIIIGLWHGGNFTFIIFGFLQACYLLPSIIYRKKIYKDEIFEKKGVIAKIVDVMLSIKTIILFSISNCFFRSETVIDAIDYLWFMIEKFSFPTQYIFGVIYVGIIIISDFIMKKDERIIFNFNSRILRFFIYFVLSYFIFAHFKFIDLSQFIYFQF